MKTGKWPVLSAEHEVGYIGNASFVVITMSRTSGVNDVLYGLMVGKSGPKNAQEFSSTVHPPRVLPRVPIHVFGV